MQMTETKARAGADVSPVQEVKQAVTGFVSDFKSFREDIQAKLQQQDERLTMLDRKSKLAARTPLASAAEIHAPHMKAFGEYLRTGDDDGLRGLELDSKSMSTAVNGDGGYLIDPQTAETIRSTLHSTASIRAIAPS